MLEALAEHDGANHVGHAEGQMRARIEGLRRILEGFDHLGHLG